MFVHNFNPILFDFGIIAIRWYSLAYIFGIILGLCWAGCSVFDVLDARCPVLCLDRQMLCYVSVGGMV